MIRLAHILLLILFSVPAYAQLSNRDTTTSQVAPMIRLHAGAGFGVLGFTYDIGTFYQDVHTIVGIRYLRSHNIDINYGLGGESVMDRPLESIWEIDSYIGKKFFDRGFTISALGGVCVLGGIQRGKPIYTARTIIPTDQPGYNEYQPLNKLAIGIPIETRVGFTPWQYYDLGISYFININSRKTFNGLFVSFRILIPFISVAA